LFYEELSPYRQEFYLQSQVIGENSVVIDYLIELAYGLQDQKSAGKCACTSTWVKKHVDWLCVMHTESDLRKQKESNASNYSLNQIWPHRFSYSFSDQIPGYLRRDCFQKRYNLKAVLKKLLNKPYSGKHFNIISNEP
jgi:hypothetical protein